MSSTVESGRMSKRSKGSAAPQPPNPIKFPKGLKSKISSGLIEADFLTMPFPSGAVEVAPGYPFGKTALATGAWKSPDDYREELRSQIGEDDGKQGGGGGNGYFNFDENYAEINNAIKDAFKDQDWYRKYSNKRKTVKKVEDHNSTEGVDRTKNRTVELDGKGIKVRIFGNEPTFPRFPLPKIELVRIPDRQGTKEAVPQARVERDTVPQARVERDPVPQARVEREPVPQARVEREPVPQARVEREPVPQARVEREPVPQARVEREPVPQARVEREPVPKARVERVPAPKAHVESDPAPKTRVERVPVPKARVERDLVPKACVERGEPVPKEQSLVRGSSVVEEDWNSDDDVFQLYADGSADDLFPHDDIPDHRPAKWRK